MDARQLERHQKVLSLCRRCPNMTGPVVMGHPVLSKVFLIGQAPGEKEIRIPRPFAWTAGKTMFGWFESIGIDEDEFRKRVYMAAVCRCFPGKNPKGGDRVPSREEVGNCSGWLEAEFRLLQPELVIPVGKLAISQLVEVGKLVEVVGKKFEISIHGSKADVVPLPHPSGASTWHRTEPGIGLLRRALSLVASHHAWSRLKAN